MKQLIILLLLPAITFAQKPKKTPKIIALSGTRSMASWPFSDPSSIDFTIWNDTTCFFRAELKKDTLRIAPSVFDSVAMRAKIIIVAGKTFQLKENNK